MIAHWHKDVFDLLPVVVWDWVSLALEHGNKERSIKDVQQDIKTGIKQMWLHSTDKEFDFCIVTQINEYPLKKTCEIVYSGGSGMIKALPELSVIEEWAVLNGCSDIQAVGRKYLSRSLKSFGYEQRYITVGKTL